MIRVGRGTKHDDISENENNSNFKRILCTTKSSPYGSLGPYELKNERGQIMDALRYRFF